MKKLKISYSALLPVGCVQTALEQSSLSSTIFGIRLSKKKPDIAAGTTPVLEDVPFAASSQLAGAGNRVEANRETCRVPLLSLRVGLIRFVLRRASPLLLR